MTIRPIDRFFQWLVDWSHMDAALQRRLDLLVTLTGAILGTLVVIAFVVGDSAGLIFASSAAFVAGLGSGLLVQRPGETSSSSAGN